MNIKQLLIDYYHTKLAVMKIEWRLGLIIFCIGTFIGLGVILIITLFDKIRGKKR